jgi:hypothetical protein
MAGHAWNELTGGGHTSVSQIKNADLGSML